MQYVKTFLFIWYDKDKLIFLRRYLISVSSESFITHVLRVNKNNLSFVYLVYDIVFIVNEELIFENHLWISDVQNVNMLIQIKRK